MKKIITSALKYILSFVIVIGIFNGLLYLVCSFNSESVKENVVESAEVLTKEGMYFQLSSVFYVFNNNMTDSFIINESYSVDSKNPYLSYMKVRRNYNEKITKSELLETTGEGVTVNYDNEKKTEIFDGEYNPIDELNDFLNNKIHYSANYGRYWHGYLVLYRPLLTFLNLSEIRNLLLVVYILLYICLLLLIKKRFGKYYAFIFGASLLCSGYFSASYSLESSPIFLITMISSIIFVKRIDKIKNVGLYCFIVGCITNFVDYLTVPLISLAMINYLYLLKLIEEGKDWKECLKSLITNSILWGVGYSFTWIFKWILYDLTINDGNNMIKIGFTQSVFRMGRTSESAHASYLFYIIDIISKSSLYILIVMGILLLKNKFRIHLRGFNKIVLPFLVLASYSIVWYIILANHTINHKYFTYRHSLVFMLGILLAFYELFIKKKKKN